MPYKWSRGRGLATVNAARARKVLIYNNQGVRTAFENNIQGNFQDFQETKYPFCNKTHQYRQLKIDSTW